MRFGSWTSLAARAITLCLLVVSLLAGPVAAAGAGDVFTGTATIGGAVTKLTVYGDYAYGVVGGRVIVVDISAPAGPVLVGQVEVSDASLTSVAAAGTMVYVTDMEHLYVVDATVATAPQLAATHSGIWLSRVAAGNGYVYLGSMGGKLQVLDLSTPQTLTVVGEVTAPVDLGVTMIEDVLLDGTMVYLPTGTSGFPDHGLWMVNVASAASPQSQGLYPLAEDDPVVGVNGGYAHVADGDDAGSNVRVVDLSNPAAPAQVSTYSPSFVVDAWRWDLPDTYVSGFAFSGTKVFVAATTTSLNVVEFSTPASPQVGGALDLSGDALAIAAQGSDVFLGGYLGGLVSVDASAFAAPELQGLAPLPATPWVGGSLGYLYMSERGIHIYDASDVVAPQPVAYSAQWDTLMAVAGRYGYALTDPQTLPPDGSSQDLSVLDLVNPTAPQEIGTYTTLNYLHRVTPAGSLLVLEELSGLDWVLGTGYMITAEVKLLDVSDPTLPQPRGSVDMNWQLNTPHYMVDTAVVGDAALICGEDLRVVNISDPDNPAVSYTDPQTCDSVTADGSYAYVLKRTGGLYVLDLSDPASPVVVTSTDISSQVATAPHMETIGAYVLNEASQPRNLHVTDLSNMAVPDTLGLFTLPDSLVDSAAIGTVYYATLASMGTHVVSTNGPADTLAISGQVLSEEGLPMPGVTIHAGDTVTTTTDASGVFRFVGLPEDTYLIYPEDPGVPSWTPAVRQASDDAAWQAFYASASPVSLTKSSTPDAGEVVSAGDLITYTIVSSGGNTGIFMDAVPTYTTYVPGSLTAPAWLTYDSAMETVTGTLPIAGTQPFIVSFSVEVSIAGTETFAPPIRNVAGVTTDDGSRFWSNAVTHPTYKWSTYLPLVIRGQ